MLVPTLSIGLVLDLLAGTVSLIPYSESRLSIGVSWADIRFDYFLIPDDIPYCLDALKYEDKGPYDAAEIMGVSRFSTFFKLTLRI